MFVGDGSGQAVVLHVHVQDYGLCEAQSSVTIPIRSISAPAIHHYEADISPTGSSWANIDGPPPPSGNWNNITWTIEHGTFPDETTSKSVFFVDDGSEQAV